MLRKHTWLAIAIIGITHTTFSWAQSSTSVQTLAQTLNELPSACTQSTADRLSDQSIKRLQAFYQATGDTLLWQDAAQRQTLAQMLRDTRYDGLEPNNYQLQRITALVQQNSPITQQCHDVLISHGYLQALQHLRDGVLDADSIEPYWYEEGIKKPVRSSIVELAASGLQDLPQAFAQARPQQQQYQALREVLKSSYILSQPDWGTVATAGKSLRVGDRDARVPSLQQRLERAGYRVAPEQPEQQLDVAVVEGDVVLAQPETIDPLLYSQQLADGVKAFQQDHYLEDDGIVGPATVRELNISPEQRLQQVRVNLERLRWLDKQLDPTMLVVDIAGARLLFFRDGQIVWRTRTQVGTVRRQTPLLKSRITHLTINPTWTVPPTILREDKIPAIRRDIGYLARSNMSVLDYQGNVLDPYSINWQSPPGLMLRQGPGPSNALGLVAIRFANPFSVYLHDTPSQHLFGRASRTVSSGCVRVEDAQKLVDQLLVGATEQELARIVQIQDSGKTRNVNLPKPVPVLLAYWTVEVDMDNRLRFRSDSYGHDQKVVAALQAAQR